MMENISTPLFEARSNALFFYSPYNFVRQIKSATQLALIRQNLARHQPAAQVTEATDTIITISSKEVHFLFYVSQLKWDSDYFGVPTLKLQAVLYPPETSLEALSAAVATFKAQQLSHSYIFIEIPSEDILLIQALGQNGFRTVETRLTYFNDDLAAYQEPRYAVRKATEADIPNLRRVAAMMRNDFDRFHADPVFSAQKADDFLATYVENSIKGFTDVVLVPDAENLASDSFLTANYFLNQWDFLGKKVSKMVLSAVSSDTNRGWYLKLISEMTYHLRDEVGSDVIFMNTQSTNRAVFRTWEKLGYRLGGTTHILSFSSI
jgi:dTDP-4-amino-4,6-dideoxy-D-galactose acyltransferase